MRVGERLIDGGFGSFMLYFSCLSLSSRDELKCERRIALKIWIMETKGDSGDKGLKETMSEPVADALKGGTMSAIDGNHVGVPFLAN